MPRSLLIAALAGVLGSAGPASAELCADPGAACRTDLPTACLSTFGAGAVPAAAAGVDCAAAFQTYRDCLARAASECEPQAQPTASPQTGGAGGSEAKAAWEAVKDSDDPAELDLVAKAFGDTFWGQLAATRAAKLRGATAPSDLRGLPADFLGVWTGPVSQPGSRPYSMKMTFAENGPFLVDYPELGCGGILSVMERRPGGAVLLGEGFTYGAQKCAQGGAMLLSKTGPNAARWLWYYPDGRLGASATLVRQ